jgi:eukaryotic-like serine/threonine-protein kinase
MPRVTCGKCFRELDYGGARPLFCAYCGQALGTPTPGNEPTDPEWSDPATITEPPRAEGRGDETIDFVPRPATGRRGEVPEWVKGYRLIRQLGRGGMGTVYEAEDSRHGRKVALKIIAPGYVDSIGAVERFRQEGRLASSLSHPRCVFVLEADEDDDGRPFIAMELMTGDTLQDLVEKSGPLEIGDAVSKILDVVEGLREAHRLGLIHRDVKPSNCFLDGDGRVKVGDFGLSKSQVGSSHLTRSGSFLGTPLYASPEQIKVEPLDERTDVYSTAATLFYLLTGRAPFDRGDASATMARIVTDPAPSAREKRPEVPIGLDRAIRKALETDRDRRTRDLGEFTRAIRAFAPGHVFSAKISLRIGAYLADALVITVTLFLLFEVLFHAPPWVEIPVDFLIALAYFAVGDGVFGASPGKRLLRLRVADRSGRESAGLARATLRAAVFLIVADLPINLFLNLDPFLTGLNQVLLFSGACLAAEAFGLAMLAVPMRATEGRRGLHDLASGTRVVSLPSIEHRRAAGPRRAIGRDRGSVSRPVGVMQAVGPYKVRGAVRWESNRRVVSGEDSTLGREAWIVIRPKGSPAPDPARREVARATRPRWLAGGEQHEGRWDAYVAPAGCPIVDLAGPEGLPWHDARPILEDLADELAAASAEGTLPPGLTVDQVWVQPDGRAILVDPLAIVDAPAGPSGRDDERALALLRRVAALALEGGRRRLDDHSATIRSPVPLHASGLLGRLFGGKDAHETVAAFRAEIKATRNLPTEVTVGQRATQLGILGLFVSIGLGSCFVLAYLLLAGRLDHWFGGDGEIGSADLASNKYVLALVYGSFFPTIWIIWDAITRGGISLKLAGLGLARWDGRKAARWRCAWRSFLVWVPPNALLIASVWVQGRIPTPAWSCWAIFDLAVALMPIYAASALISPSSGPHDQLSGLRVVPH